MEVLCVGVVGLTMTQRPKTTATAGPSGPFPAASCDDAPPADVASLSAVVEMLSDVVAVQLDPVPVMRLIVERTRRLTGADGAVIAVLEGSELVHSAASGLAAPFLGARRAIAGSLSAHTLITGEIDRCDDVEHDSRVDRDLCDRMGVRSMVLVPLRHDGVITAVLKVLSRRPRAFDDRHVWLLRVMGGVFSTAIHNATEFEAKRRLLAELRASEERFRCTFEHAAIGIALVALDGHWLKVNRAACDMLGYTEAEMLERTFQDLTHPDDLATDVALSHSVIAGERHSFQLEKRYVRKDGRIVCALLGVAMVRAADGRPLHFVSQIHDITERKRGEQLEADRGQILEMVAQDRPLAEVLGRLAQLVDRQVDAARTAVVLLADGRVTCLAPGLPGDIAAALRPIALSLGAALATASASAVHDPGAPPPAAIDLAAEPAWATLHDAAAARGLGACRGCRVSGADDAPAAMILVFEPAAPAPAADAAREVERVLAAAAHLAAICVEHHRTTRQLDHLVRHDPLTGLPNRILCEDRLEQALAAARRSGRPAAVLVLDVDRFKQINDTLGHAAGDDLLVQFGHRLRARLRAPDTLARVGGDEFVAVLPELTDPADAATVAAKLVAALAEPFAVAGQTLPVTSSIGVAVYPSTATPPPPSAPPPTPPCTRSNAAAATPSPRPPHSTQHSALRTDFRPRASAAPPAPAGRPPASWPSRAAPRSPAAPPRPPPARCSAPTSPQPASPPTSPARAARARAPPRSCPASSGRSTPGPPARPPAPRGPRTPRRSSPPRARPSATAARADPASSVRLRPQALAPCRPRLLMPALILPPDRPTEPPDSVRVTKNLSVRFAVVQRAGQRPIALHFGKMSP